MATLGLLRIVVASTAVALLGGVAHAGPAGSEEEEPFLRAPDGPYRGTVLDAKTNRPIPDAAVVIIWQTADERFDGRRIRVSIQETLTDAAGRFVLDVAKVESGLPPRSFPPRLLIYRPGYTPVPPETLHPPGVPARQFKGPGTIVRLTPITDPEDRAEAFNAIFGSDIMPNESPVLWDLLKFEAENFGYK